MNPLFFQTRWLLLFLLFSVRLYASELSIGRASAYIDSAEAAVASKRYSEAFDQFIEADIMLHRLQISQSSKAKANPELQKDIFLCESEIKSLPRKIATALNISSNIQSAYVRAWLEVQRGFNLRDQKYYRTALESFKDSAIMLRKIQSIDSNWDSAVFQSRLNDINKELIQLPILIAFEEASNSRI